MLTHLRIQNFKSWRDTGQMRFAPLTGFFGPNSSGKSSILQFLLMLKQTAEAHDQSQVLNLGLEQSAYVDLGTFSEILSSESSESNISFEIEWLPDPYTFLALVGHQFSPLEFQAEVPLAIDQPKPARFAPLHLDAQIGLVNDILVLKRLTVAYDAFRPFQAALEWQGISQHGKDYVYRFDYKLLASDGSMKAGNYTATIQSMNLFVMSLWGLRQGSSGETSSNHMDQDSSEAVTGIQNVRFSFTMLVDKIDYLGPLREVPNRLYLWRGSAIDKVGLKGEQSIQALLSREFTHSSNGADSYHAIEWVVSWLKRLGLIHSFEISKIAEGRREYEVVVRQSPEGPLVLLTNVGFGVSQVLPVLVLCALAEEGSTIIFEQPEIHLHPAVQAGLADVFIDVVKTRHIQIILESHSEHLLIRLQRRMAEERLMPEDVALYFTRIEDGESKLEELQIDQYGNISNWPENFFGDRLGDLVAMTEAAMNRQISQPVNGTSG